MNQEFLQYLMSNVWAIRPEVLQAMQCAAMSGGVESENIAQSIARKYSPAADRRLSEKPGAVAIVPIHGVITQRHDFMNEIFGGGSAALDTLTAQMTELNENGDIKAIVLDINSPGGTVSMLPETANMIYEMRGKKPIIAQVDSFAASAAYWIAAAADEIVVPSSGYVGSVGVLRAHENYAKRMEDFGVAVEFIYSGKYKVEGNPYEPLSEDARDHYQSEVDRVHEDFISDLSRFRGTDKKTVRESFGQGRMVSAQASVSRGMSDRIGTLKNTLDRLGVGLYPKNAGRNGTRANAQRHMEIIEREQENELC
jgi:signal peptide peptidase SppA